MWKISLKNICLTVSLSWVLLGVFWLLLFQYNGSKQMSVTQKNRKSILKSGCQLGNLSNHLKNIDRFVAKRLFVEQNHKFIYCEVPKVGCTNWKRIIFLLKMNISAEASSIDHDALHSSTLLKRLGDFSKKQQHIMLQNYTKVMFTRDPLERIVSAYRDKFLHSGGYYGGHVANKIKSKFRKNSNSTEDVSFNEFISYILQQNPKRMDIHWMPMHLLCDPCNINYDILGKFSTLRVDSDHVLRVIGAPANLKYPETKQYNESRTDEKKSTEYISQLPLHVLEKLIEIYSLDYRLFDYVQ